MRYEVLWSPTAERELLALIASTADPEGIVAAAWAINRQLEERSASRAAPANA